MSKKHLADLSLLTITAVWGASFPLMKIVLEYMPAFAYISIRMIVASIFLVLVFAKKLKKLNRNTVNGGSIIGLFLSAGMVLQVYGLYYTTASNSAFITGLNVIFVPIVSALLLKRKPGLAPVAGVILAFAGLFFLTGGINADFNRGDLLTFICAICFTFHIIFIAKYTDGEDPVLIAIVQLVAASALCTVLWFIKGIEPFTLNYTVIFIVITTSLLGTAAAFVVQTIAQKYTTPVHTALIITAEPVFGVIFAMLIPDINGNTELLSATAAVGCILIIAGMLISEIRSKHCSN